MILPLHEQVRARVRAVLAQLHGITDHDLVIPIEYPPNRTLGDLGTPVAFDLARRLRKAPRVIAQELAARSDPFPELRVSKRRPTAISTCSSTAPRFCWRGSASPASCRRLRARTEQDHRRAHRDQSQQGRAHRASPEFRARRHAGAGARFRGNPVEVQNYIDDTGVQVADVVVGFRELEKADPRRCAAHRADRRDSITTAGICTRASRSGTRATRTG